MDTIMDRLEDLEEDLAARAFLFDHPATYREAVERAMEAVKALVEKELVAA